MIHVSKNAYSTGLGVITNTCEQCGRNRIPKLHSVTSIEKWLDLSNAKLKLVSDPTSEQTIASPPSPKGIVELLIGTEGGLSQAELTRIKQYAYTSIRLGPCILRAETAVVSAITALQTIWGDLK